MTQPVPTPSVKRKRGTATTTSTTSTSSTSTSNIGNNRNNNKKGGNNLKNQKIVEGQAVGNVVEISNGNNAFNDYDEDFDWDKFLANLHIPSQDFHQLPSQDPPVNNNHLNYENEINENPVNMIASILNADEDYGDDERRMLEMLMLKQEQGDNGSIMKFLESMRSKYSIPPVWITKCLSDCLNIEANVVEGWWLHSSSSPETTTTTPESSCSIQEAATIINNLTCSTATSSSNSEFNSAPGGLWNNPRNVTFEQIQRQVARNMSLDVNSLMLNHYSQSLPYLTMSMFKHNVQLPNSEILYLDDLLRHPDDLISRFASDSGLSLQVIDALFAHLCELESFMVYFSVNKYFLEQQIQALTRPRPPPSRSRSSFSTTGIPSSSSSDNNNNNKNNMKQPSKVPQTVSRMATRRSNRTASQALKADPVTSITPEQWKCFQQEMQMISSNDIYNQLDDFSANNNNNFVNSNTSDLDTLAAYISQTFTD